MLRSGALFGHDDGRLYANELCRVLEGSGHTVESTSIPFSGAVSDVMSQSVAYRLFDLGRRFDACVTIGPFSHAFMHHNKHVWLLSQYGPLYQLWDTPYGASSANPDDRSTREYVLAADRAWLTEAQVVCAASETLSQALTSHETAVRLLPPSLPDQYRRAPIEYGDYFLAVSPLTDDARISLVIKGFEKSKVRARLVIMGFECTAYEREHVEKIVAASPKADLITLEIDPSYDRAFDRVASALALVTTVFGASALDVFSMAAGISRKPVITTTDSGDLAAVIEHAFDGYTVEPTADALGDAMDEVFANKDTAVRLGNRFSEKLSGILPSWSTIATELTT